MRYPAVLIALVMAVGLLLAVRSSQAEFELPVVDATSFVPTDFRSVWGFYRSQQTGDQATTGLAENYEAWAVGKDTSNADPAQDGVLYRWQGQEWQQVMPHPKDNPGSTVGVPTYSAVGGQYSYETGNARMWVSAFDNATARLLNTYLGGSQTSPNSIASELDPGAQFTNAAVSLVHTTVPPPTAACTANVCAAGSIYAGRACLDATDCPVTQSLNRPIYGIAAAQTQGGHILAGGKDGLLMSHAAYSTGCPVGGCNQCAPNGFCLVNTSQSCIPATAATVCRKNPDPDTWQNISTVFSNAAVDGANAATDDITGVIYAGNDIAYVITTNFGSATHPYDRTCLGSETGRLFRVVGDPSVVGNWKKIAEKANTCFFGVAAGPMDTTSSQTTVNNGPLRNYVWIAAGSDAGHATNKGVFRVVDSDFRSSAGLYAVTRVYAPPASENMLSVVAARDIGGDRPSSGDATSNLLQNGELNSWLTTTPPASPADTTVNPDVWRVVQDNTLEQRGSSGAASCNVQNNDLDIKIVSDSIPDKNGGGTDFAVQIEPGRKMETCTSSPFQYVFYPTADAHISSGSPGSNFGSLASLTMNSGASAFDVMMKFDVSGWTSNSIVTNSALHLYATKGTDAGGGGRFYPASASPSWTESGVTWSNAPGTVSPAVGYLPQSISSGSYYSVSLTNSSGQPYISAYGTYSLRVKSESPTNNNVTYSSKETAGTSQDPYLTVDVDNPPIGIDTGENAAGAAYVANRVPLSGVEGKRYRITGKYKVEMLTGNVDIPTDRPPNAFGGVQIGCAGGNPPDSGVDCTMSSNQYLRRTATVTSGSCDQNGGPGGFGCIDTIISREDGQLAKPIKGLTTVCQGGTNPGTSCISNSQCLGGGACVKNTGQGLDLEVRCIGTYGTRVTCDDLHVEEVNTPPVPPHDSYFVTAVGQGGLVVTSQDGASVAAPTFVVEDNPSAGPDLTAVSAVDPGHVYVAGINSTVLQRSSGSINGYIWAGTGSPGNVGDAAAGWISTNCANSPLGRAVGTPSLCQTSSSTYGVSLDGTRLTGRAWFGKKVGGGEISSDESTNLGSCQGAGILSTNQPYVITGSCNTLTTTAADGTPPRTCHGDGAHTKVCLRDFDCYGRCSGDNGFLCLTNQDCQVGSATGGTISGTELSNFPKFRVQCDQNNASALACTNGGWLTFNPNEFIGSPPGSINVCGGPGGVCVHVATNALKGVAQFTTLANPDDPTIKQELIDNPSAAAKSWVSFQGPSSDAAASSLYGCKSCSVAGGEMNCKYCQDENNRSCIPAANPPANPPYAYSPNTCHLFCDGDRVAGVPCVNDGQCASGTCRAAGYCSLKSGGTLVPCASDANCAAAAGGSCVLGADCNPAGASCRQYGVNFDDASGKFGGYAWSPAYGWLAMSGLQQGTSRFIQTKLGDIYATGRIGASDVNTPTACNATYLISTPASIVNFCSSLISGAVTVVDENAPQISFASPSNTFTNVLGRFDLTGMEQPAKVVGTVNYNKYGSKILPLPYNSGTGVVGTSADWPAGIVPLNGNVFTVTPTNGTVYLNSAKSFTNNCASVASAAGLVIIHGNLTINGNLSYLNCSPTPTDLRQIASLVVVVTGDLTIDNAVMNLVGTYYVQGTINTASAISSGTNRYPLTVRGLMIAKRFIFGRKFAGTIDNPLPSELIILDGRLQSNPLPGMTDFAAALPNTINTGP